MPSGQFPRAVEPPGAIGVPVFISMKRAVKKAAPEVSEAVMSLSLYFRTASNFMVTFKLQILSNIVSQI